MRKRLEHKKDSAKWHDRYLSLAQLISSWSKHPDFQVGAVAIGDFGQILSTGYNGWPRGLVNEENGRGETNRRGLSYSIHAEANLIYNANLNCVSLSGSTVYVHPVFPCLACSLALVQVGVSQICYKRLPLARPNEVAVWQESWDRAEELFRDTGVQVTRVNG